MNLLYLSHDSKQKMITKILAKLFRKKQLNKLFKFSSFTNIKIGDHNHFTLYPDLKKITLGKNIRFRNYIHIVIGSNATLKIEDNVFMNNFCSINCLHEISIGENTLFGENVKIYDHNHLYEGTPKFRVSHKEFTKAPVSIGKNCWLGSNVTILKGVKIGDNCIIGAGCTIYKDIPANTRIINKQALIHQTIS